MNARRDAHLWVAYATAPNDAARKELATQIISCHLGFIRQYANATAFPQWNADLRDEYMHELVAEAMKRIPAYDRRRINSEGRTASYLTYMKPYLLEVRWRLAGREAPIPVGKETVRMRAFGQRFISEALRDGHPHPTWEKVAAAIGEAHGKSVSPERAELLCRPAPVLRPDANTSDSDSPAAWSALPVLSDSAEDVAVSSETQHRVTEAVSEAVRTHATTPTRQALVERRLSAAKPVAMKALAAELNIPLAVLKAEEAELLEALRAALSCEQASQSPPQAR